MQITNFQLELNGATWVDVNSQFTLNGLPDRLPDSQAISNSIFNILNCPIGARGRIFQPEYGSLWYQFLQEPIDNITAVSMNMAMIQALVRWEPRIQVNTSNSFIQPDLTLPGYNVRIAYTVLLTSSAQAMSFNLQP